MESSSINQSAVSPVRDIIQRCREAKSTRLDLGECRLRQIPEDIWEMDWIEELILGNNPSENSNYDLFKVDPEVYSTLFPPTTIQQSNESNATESSTNKLKFTANKYGTNILREADLSGISNLKKLRYLNLNRCDLFYIDSLLGIKQLDILLIGGNPRLRLDFQSEKEFPKFRVRVVDLFGITGQASGTIWAINGVLSLFDDDYVSILDISFNSLSSEPSRLQQRFKNLISLDVSYTNGASLFPLGFKPLLQFFRAEGCEFTSINMGDLPPGLKYLNVNSTKVRDFSFLTSLPNLERLFLNRNNITNLKGMEQHTQLQELNIEDNKIKDITPISELPSLKSLYASGNEISELPSLRYLKTLEVLSVSENQLSNSNQIEKTLVELPQLKTLHLFKNPLNEIPTVKLGTDRYFNCLESIIHHFKSLEKGIVSNNEIKLILIGNSTAGKTTLRKLLQGKKYNSSEDSTHGIVMETWSIKGKALKEFSDSGSLQVHIWDFGGQEYYHETHKLFFSNNAVYVVVWEAKTNMHKIIPTPVYETRNGQKYNITKYIEHQPYDYWLKNIRHYAPNCNILVVQNKIDTYLDSNEEVRREGEQNGLPRIRIKRLEDETLNDYSVYEAFDLSLKKYAEKETDYVFDYQKFERQLTKVLAKTVHQFKLGRSYDDVKQRIRDIKDKNVLTYDEYSQICIQAGIANQTDIPQLSKYLTDTSVILHYPDHPALSQSVFINPVWVSDTIYSILNNSVLERSGVFDELHVKNVLRNEKLANDFIELMKRFELIFPLSEETPGDADDVIKKFVAPQYLPEGSPTRSYDIYKSLCGEPKLTIRFPQFMPKTFMNGLLSKFASRSIDKSYFRYGVAFTTDWVLESKENNINIIECKFEDEKIEVYSKTPNPYNLREIFEAILNVYTGFRTVNAQTPDPSRPTMGVLDEICRTEIPVHLSVDGTNFVSWNDLFKRWNNIDKPDPITEDSIVMPVQGVPQVAALFKAYCLNKSDVQSLGTIAAANLQPPKLFISYSHKDELYKDELLEHLSGMRRSGEIKDWTDRAVTSGEIWDEVIKKNLQEADIILFLLSSSFVASDYIQNVEIKSAIEKYNKPSNGMTSIRKPVIIPILVRPCDYKSLPLRDIQSATKDFKPISTYTSRDEGWTQVIGNLRVSIDSWKSGRIVNVAQGTTG
jgi:internalin A